MSTQVLVINDDASILDLFKMLLEDEGYEVYASLETIENVVDVERIQPELVILDLKIGMHQEGWVMMQKLRMYPPTAKIPIILCTAALDEVSEQEATLIDKGIPVVYKPFDLEELLKAVHSVLAPEEIRRKGDGKANNKEKSKS
ncbi:response regulator [Ktedonobacteria bacterium brp13]|nr:response regulator [Ktedonobacteria bacterium brp13]